MDSSSGLAALGFATGFIVGVTVNVLPEEIDLFNLAGLGAAIGASVLGGLGVLFGRDYARLAALGAAGGIAVGVLVGLVILVVQS